MGNADFSTGHVPVSTVGDLINLLRHYPEETVIDKGNFSCTAQSFDPWKIGPIAHSGLIEVKGNFEFHILSLSDLESLSKVEEDINNG